MFAEDLLAERLKATGSSESIFDLRYAERITLQGGADNSVSENFNWQTEKVLLRNVVPFSTPEGEDPQPNTQDIPEDTEPTPAAPATPSSTTE